MSRNIEGKVVPQLDFRMGASCRLPNGRHISSQEVYPKKYLIQQLTRSGYPTALPKGLGGKPSILGCVFHSEGS